MIPENPNIVHERTVKDGHNNYDILTYYRHQLSQSSLNKSFKRYTASGGFSATDELLVPGVTAL